MRLRAAIIGVGAVLPSAHQDRFAVERADPTLAKTARMMSRGAFLAAMAVRDALAAAPVDPARTAAYLAVGASSGAVDDVARILVASVEDGKLDLPRFATKGVGACNPLLAFQLMNNFTLCHAAIREGLQGPNGAFFEGAGDALAEAMVALDEVPHALAGAADTALHPVTAQERSGDPRLPGEAAVVLLLARESESPLAWVEAAPDALPDIGDAEVLACFGDCRAAGPALAWWLALERLSVQKSVVAGGYRFSAASPLQVLCQQEVDRLTNSPLHPAFGHLLPQGEGEGFGFPPPLPGPRPDSGPPKAVITAVGAVSAFGAGIDALWDGLLSGRAAFQTPPHLPGMPISGVVPLGIEVLDPWISEDLRASWAARGWLRDRRLPWALAAAVEAWQAAGEPEDLALSLGLGLEQAFLDDLIPLVSGARLDWSRAPAPGGLRYRAPFDLPARALAERIPLGPRRLLHASACAAGTLAVSQAAAWIARGEAESVLCGAADSMLNPLGLAGLARLGVISARGACRPFDRRRDGILVGEGAACFVVEREDRAIRRGAPILAKILGWGSSQDGYGPTAPRPGGGPARQAMASALARAGLPPEAITLINAHGTGTPTNDEAEAAAIRDLFPSPPPVGSFKGALGHGMAAAGALELAGCLVAFARGVMPGTSGHERPDPGLDLPILVEARSGKTDIILKNSFGFGGQNASLILGNSDA